MADLIEPFDFAVFDSSAANQHVFSVSIVDRSQQSFRGRFNMFAYPTGNLPGFGELPFYVFLDHEILDYPIRTDQDKTELACLVGTVFCGFLQGAAIGWEIVRRDVEFHGDRRHELDVYAIANGRHLSELRQIIVKSTGDYRDRCRWDVLRYGVRIYREKGFGHSWMVDDILESGLVTFPYTKEFIEQVAISLSMEKLLGSVNPGYEVEPEWFERLHARVGAADAAWIASFVQIGKKIAVLDNSAMIHQEGQFDVFICYNSEDRPIVREVVKALQTKNIRCWLDIERLRPGLPWQQSLQQQIERIPAAAVFVGKSGIGPWQNGEIQAYLSQFVKRGCPVIPVILEDATNSPGLPPFLSNMTWVDFRDKTHDPLQRLIWGVTGRRD